MELTRESLTKDPHQKLDLLEELRYQVFLEKQVLLGKETKQKVRIICNRLAPQQVLAKRRKANKLAKPHSYKSSQKIQRLLNLSMFITNTSENKINSEYIFVIYNSHIHIEALKGKFKLPRILYELYAKLCIILIFHGMAGCIKLEKHTEISFTKAIIELKNRARELLLALNTTLDTLQVFLKKLIYFWSRVSLKDRYRKSRISTFASVL